MRLFYYMPVKQFSYNKKEKLKSRKQLEQLFIAGTTFIIFPVKVIYKEVEAQDSILKTGVGTSRKNFKKAVERNRIKRLLRETYRTEKPVLLNYLQQNKKQIALFFLYIDKSLPEYNLLKQKMQQAIEKLIKNLDEVAS
jgi:ribonuclease P protein component